MKRLFILLGAALPLLAATGGLQAQSLVEYGRACAIQVAPIPPFDCAAGVLVPITVDGGRTPERYTSGMSCDRPSLLRPEGDEKTDGQCVPNSRALVLRDDDRAQISAFCRQKIIRPAGTHLYDEIDIVAHNVRTGSTCWFQASAPLPLRADRGVDGRRVPPPHLARPLPGYPAAQHFWNAPKQVADALCVRCHDSGPFMYSPFIAQTGALPGDPFGPYKNDVGEAFRRWPQPFGISTRANTCTTCHRIGNMNSCQVALYEATGALRSPGLDEWGTKFPQSHWMPPGALHSHAQWNTAYAGSVKQLAACCQNPQAPGCLVERYAPREPGSRR